MSTEITIDLSDYLEECQETLEDNGYKVFEDDFDVQKYYEKNFDTGISDLAEYVHDYKTSTHADSEDKLKVLQTRIEQAIAFIKKVY